MAAFLPSSLESAALAMGQPKLFLHSQDESEVEKAFAPMAERHVRGLLYGLSTYFFPGESPTSSSPLLRITGSQLLRVAGIRRRRRANQL